MDKQAIIGEKMVFWLQRFIFLIIALLSVWLLVNYFVITKLDTDYVEAEVVFNRLMYSPTGFAYADRETGRAYPGIIDLEKFKTENLDQAVKFGKPRAAARLVLYRDGKQVGEPAFLNEQWMRRWSPRLGFKGSGAAVLLEKQLPVVYKDGEEFKTGLLKVNVVVPKS
jgi:hypothetical protein